MNMKIVCSLLAAGLVSAADVYTLNFKPDSGSALAKAGEAEGITFKPLGTDVSAAAGRTILVSAKGDWDNPKDPFIDALCAHVREGGRLVIFSSQASRQMIRLASVLPTTGFMTTDGRALRGRAEVAETAEGWDAVAGLSVPAYFEVRPYHVIERGQEKHWIYSRPWPFTAYTNPGKFLADRSLYTPPRTWFWTRPIDNRDWRILLRLNDGAQSPLLLSGRCGAGMSFASGADLAGLPESPEAVALWRDLLRTEPNSTVESVYPVRIAAVKSRWDKRVAGLLIESDGKQTAEVVLRQLSFEGTPVADFRKTVKLRKGKNEVRFELPAPNCFSPRESVLNDSYICRFGVLTDGGKVCTEKEVRVDFAPEVTIQIRSDEARIAENPFPGTGFTGRQFLSRYGFQSGLYAYRPGDTVNLQIALRNGVRNLAAEAVVSDLNKPENRAVNALFDNGISRAAHADWYAADGYPVFTLDKTKTERISFRFETPVTLESIGLMSGTGVFRNWNQDAPGSIVISADGVCVYTNTVLAGLFAADRGNGKVLLKLAAPVRATEWILEFPAEPDRKAPAQLGEVYLWGWRRDVSTPKSETLKVRLVDVFSGKETEILKRRTDVLGTETVSASFRLPESARPSFYRVEADYAGEVGVLPLAAVRPSAPLAQILDDTALGRDSVSIGMIVSKGFRVVMPFGAGSADLPPGWGNPDDLIWAYAFGFKENGRVLKDRLVGQAFASDDDIRHYITPWRPFTNGEEFFAAVQPYVLEKLKKHPNWKSAKHVIFSHSDRWDTGPNLHVMFEWQDISAFDDFLRRGGREPLKGKTRSELIADIKEHRLAEWRRWHLDRYLGVLKSYQDLFAKEGKEFHIQAQGAPIIPVPEGDGVMKVVSGAQNDSTWGLEQESPAMTAGRQLGMVALAPELNMRVLSVWGYCSAILNNPQWRGSVATTEASRRVYMSQFFRGRLRADGRYTSMHSQAFSENARHSNRTSEQDYQDWLQLMTQGALFTPEAPLGAGLIVAVDKFNDPQRLNFSFGEGMPDIERTMELCGLLSAAGVPVSFSGRLDLLAKWKGCTPLVVVNPEELTERELVLLGQVADRGCRVAAFAVPEKLPETVRRFFEGPNRVLVPFDLNKQTAAAFSKEVSDFCDKTGMPIRFSRGLNGYGFVSNGRRFIVVEDYREDPRIGEVRLLRSSGTCKAVELNGHTELKTHRDGAFWVIEVPVVPGTGCLLAVEEN